MDQQETLATAAQPMRDAPAEPRAVDRHDRIRAQLTTETLRADVIVVGSGAGGAPVAASLAEAGLDVLVLEAGPRVETREFTGEPREMLARRRLAAKSSSDMPLTVLFAGPSLAPWLRFLKICS